MAGRLFLVILTDTPTVDWNTGSTFDILISQVVQQRHFLHTAWVVYLQQVREVVLFTIEKRFNPTELHFSLTELH